MLQDRLECLSSRKGLDSKHFATFCSECQGPQQRPRPGSSWLLPTATGPFRGPTPPPPTRSPTSARAMLSFKGLRPACPVDPATRSCCRPCQCKTGPAQACMGLAALKIGRELSGFAVHALSLQHAFQSRQDRSDCQRETWIMQAALITVTLKALGKPNRDAEAALWKVMAICVAYVEVEAEHACCKCWQPGHPHVVRTRCQDNAVSFE